MLGSSRSMMNLRMFPSSIAWIDGRHLAATGRSPPARTLAGPCFRPMSPRRCARKHGFEAPVPPSSVASRTGMAVRRAGGEAQPRLSPTARLVHAAPRARQWRGQGMRIVLVGASGTVGQAVAKELGERHEIVAVGSKSGAVQLDVTDAASIRAGLARIGAF